MCFCYNTVIRFACKLKFCHYSRQRDLWRRHLYQIKWRLFCFGIWSITSWIFFPIKKWISLKYVLNMSCCQSLTQQLLNRLRELEIRSLSLRLERRPRRLNGESLLLRSSRCAAAVLLSSALLSTPQVCSSREESQMIQLFLAAGRSNKRNPVLPKHHRLDQWWTCPVGSKVDTRKSRSSSCISSCGPAQWWVAFPFT